MVGESAASYNWLVFYLYLYLCSAYYVGYNLLLKKAGLIDACASNFFYWVSNNMLPISIYVYMYVYIYYVPMEKTQLLV